MSNWAWKWLGQAVIGTWVNVHPKPGLFKLYYSVQVWSGFTTIFSLVENAATFQLLSTRLVKGEHHWYYRRQDSISCPRNICHPGCSCPACSPGGHVPWWRCCVDKRGICNVSISEPLKVFPYGFPVVRLEDGSSQDLSPASCFSAFVIPPKRHYEVWIRPGFNSWSRTGTYSRLLSHVF